MGNFEEKAIQISNEVTGKFSSYNREDGRVVNAVDAITLLPERLANRFKLVNTKEEAISLVKIWIDSPEVLSQNWDVAFLISNYELDFGSSDMKDFAEEILGIDVTDKQSVYGTFGLLKVRYAELEVKKRLLRFFRKAYGTSNFFKKMDKVVMLDNVQHYIDRDSYFKLLRLDFMNLETKFRKEVRNSKGKELEDAWQMYSRFLALAFYLLLLTETEERMFFILQNISGVNVSRDELQQVVEAFPENFTTIFEVQFFFSIQVLKKKSDVKSISMYEGLAQANKWMLEYGRLEFTIKKLANKEAIKHECLRIFFPTEICKYLRLKEIDGNQYDLIVLYRGALKKSSSLRTKQRRIDGSRNRTAYVKSLKLGRKSQGKFLHEKYQAMKLKDGKATISKLAKEAGLSRDVVYKKLYEYYYSLYIRTKNENSGLSVEKIFEIVVSEYGVKRSLVEKSVEKHNESTK